MKAFFGRSSNASTGFSLKEDLGALSDIATGIYYMWNPDDSGTFSGPWSLMTYTNFTQIKAAFEMLRTLQLEDIKR